MAVLKVKPPPCLQIGISIEAITTGMSKSTSHEGNVVMGRAAIKIEHNRPPATADKFYPTACQIIGGSLGV